MTTTSNAVAELLPKLRRYARALTGSQPSGDAYVGATLEALAADPAILAQARDPRIGLFAAFSRIWNSAEGSSRGEPVDADMPPDRHLVGLTPRPRQAFLLVAMEGFPEEAAAEILGVSVAELRRLVEDSGREMAVEIATDVLIIEDEPMIAMDLESLVEGLGHQVTGIARTHAEAVALAKARRPGLILADIRLADMSSGLDAVNEVLQMFEVPVIFITAYPEQFLTGERPEPTFLITKPFPPTMVSAVISQALFFEQKAHRRSRPSPASVR
jgi:CheY-like chemotaxis protein